MTVTSQVDLPPTYNDIGQYQKVEDSNSKPPEYVEPPAYSSWLLIKSLYILL